MTAFANDQAVEAERGHAGAGRGWRTGARQPVLLGEMESGVLLGADCGRKSALVAAVKAAAGAAKREALRAADLRRARIARSAVYALHGARCGLPRCRDQSDRKSNSGMVERSS